MKNKNRTCDECKWYNKSTEKEDPIMGILHVCDKNIICNSWNLIDRCVYFEEIKDISEKET